MDSFEFKKVEIFTNFGESKNMVLSSSYQDKVTSRMMSVIIFDGEFYFQTDKNFRKYSQIKNNPNVSLCCDNISVEGVCTEIGKPLDNNEFIKLYKKHYNYSFQQYSSLNNERLFKVTPAYIQMWTYKNSKPYIEILDFISGEYIKTL
ncbi:MAG: pyridoxamine 5'-phosphate oxidase family protein [Elusimicrobiales bacterium]|nr:pyridoxamine 5'-phosphate oxidase family protein [Elusimicrobiales bacterium]